MYHGRNKLFWHHTSHILAILHNVNIDPEQDDPVTPMEINPYYSGKTGQCDRKKPDFYISDLSFFSSYCKQQEPNGGK